MWPRPRAWSRAALSLPQREAPPLWETPRAATKTGLRGSRARRRALRTTGRPYSSGAAAGDSLLDFLDLGMLEAEQLRDAAREMGLDLGQRAVGIDDAPDRFHELQALLAR